MTLDEAIKHAQWVADTNCDQCAEDHRQLTEWLKELKELRKLGWHPASELPQLDKNGGSGLVYALGKVFSKEFGEYLDKVPCRVRVIHGKWAPEDIEVEWWCYQPKED